MLRLLDRYIFADLLRVLLLTTGILGTVTAFGAAIKPLASDSLLTAAQTAKYVTFAIVPMLQFAIPFAAGFAGTISLHRMASDNEVLAASVGGVSYHRLLRPVCALGLVLTVVMVVLTQWVIPRFWGLLDHSVQQDLTSIFQAAIERGEPFSYGERQVYADRLIVDPDPAGSEADTRLILVHVAAAETDSKGRIVKDFTANNAVVDIYRRPGTTYIKLSMVDAVAYDPDGGMLMRAAVLDFPTVVLSNRLHDDAAHMTRGELLALRRAPDRYHDVERFRSALAEAIREVEVAGRINETLRAAGSVELVAQTPDGARYEVRADKLEGGRFVEGEGEGPVEVVRYEGDSAVRTLRSRDVALRRHDTGPLADLTFDLVLTECEVSSPSLRNVVNRRQRVALENLAPQGFGGPDLRDLPTDELVRRAEAYQGPESSRLRQKVGSFEHRIDELQLEITARLLRRYALSVTALILILLGAVLAIWRRGSLPLTIYLWAFMPSIFDLILINSGGHVLRDDHVLAGIAVMWSGNAGLLIMLAVAYFALSRH